jgi:alpha-amylase/alpha-mannosidase (GH57 family)
MERFICIHGHFYQPPRENPWLEAVEIQDSAYPYHDWNERVTAECYAPNTASRRLDGEGRIMGIASNYARISFNFGPTLLSWMEDNSPEVYRAILEADQQSLEWRSGHGSALAQVYNHVIMPLASRQDKLTQVLWGIRDFEHRFRRFPEGMWLAETAVDIETLEVLAEAGIAFTILAPHQAWRVRKNGGGKWQDVSGMRIDPTRAYLCRLPSGRRITLFFYDGPISRAVAFEKLLNRGEDFADRLQSGFSGHRHWPQLLHIATDGETYGHHHRFGEMALGHALDYIERNGLARLTNYGEYLALHPPTHEVQIFENSSWSCSHGIERWRSNCGCNSGGRPGWDQGWRGPLRSALDWLRDQLAFRYESRMKEMLKDPWSARDDYIELMGDRSERAVAGFLDRHALRRLDETELVTVLELLEMQRHALLMYTSCGWFFDEISGVETVQVLQYAGRAIQIAQEYFYNGLEDAFRERLAEARSNLPELGNGARVYERFVKSAMVDLIKVAAHYAVSSVFEEYAGTTKVFSYRVCREDSRLLQSGRTKLQLGRIRVRSSITGERDRITFCTLYFGNHAVNGGVRAFLGEEAYRVMQDEITRAFEESDFASIIRLMDIHFGMHTYSIRDLFRDEQRKILQRVLAGTLEDFEKTFIDLFENNRLLMGFVQETGMPVPRRFLTTAQIALNLELQKAFAAEDLDVERIRGIIAEIGSWQGDIDAVDLEFLMRRKLERAMDDLLGNPEEITLLNRAQRLAEIVIALPVDLNLWQAQNTYDTLGRSVYPAYRERARNADRHAADWVANFSSLGQLLFFNVPAFLAAQ